MTRRDVYSEWAEAPRAPVISRWVARLAGGGIVAAVAIAAVIWATGRPISWIGATMVAAVPLLLVGQLWSIALVTAALRRTEPVRGWSARVRRMLRAVVGGLPTWAGVISVAGFYGAVVLAALAIPAPSDEVSTRAATQLGGALALAAFFIVHTTVAAGDLVRRRQSGEPAG